MSTEAVSQVYWPSSLQHGSSRMEDGGYVIGFNSHSLVVVVVAVLNQSHTLSEATSIVSKLERYSNVKTITEKYTQGFPTILGILRSRSRSNTLAQTQYCKETHLWLLFDQLANGWPKLSEIYCFGMSYHSSAQIIFYEPPSPKSNLVHSVEPLLLYPKNNEYLISKYEAQVGDFELTLNQVQYSWTIERALSFIVSKSSEKIVTFEDTSPYLGGRFVTIIIHYLMAILVFLKPMFEFMLWLFRPAVSQDTSSRSAPSSVKSHPPQKQSKSSSSLPISSSESPKITWSDRGKKFSQSYRSILSFSCFAQRMSSRMENLLLWPRIWERRFTDITWVHFYNQILLLLIDFILGLLLGIFVWRNQGWVFEQSVRWHNFMRYDFSQAYIEWLMGWPAGFKLNDELDLFLGNVFLLYIDNWSVIALYMAKVFPIVIKLISILGFFGLSSVLALLSDVFAFLNMHIYWLYTAIAKACSLQLSALSSLWLLFRGKKRNVLKKRIDSCNYTIDQLLLGTLMFCVLFFLIPTMGTYYLFFLVARVMILSIHGFIAVCLVIIEKLPILPLALFFGKSTLLSGGVRFELCERKSDNKDLLEGSEQNDEFSQSNNVTESTYLYLKPNPQFSTGFFFEEIKCHIANIKLSLQ